VTEQGVEQDQLVVGENSSPQVSSSIKTEQKQEDYASLPNQRLEFKRSLSGSQGLIVGIGIGILLTAIGTRLFWAESNQSSVASSSEVIESVAPAQSVTVTTVKEAQVDRTFLASGTVAASELIPVMSQATGLQIKQILVEEGDYVEQGQMLARLDDAVLQAELMQAKAAVAQGEARLAELQAGSRAEEIAQAQERVRSAEATVIQAESDLDLISKRVERNRTLEAEGAIARDRLDEILNQQRVSQANLQQAQANLQEAKQQLAQLKAGSRPETIMQAQGQLAEAQGRLQLATAQLQNTLVVAPTSGKIAERNARLGDITSSSDTLFTIIENGSLELQLQVPETLLSSIRLGQKVTITSDVDSPLQLSGQIKEIEPTINRDSRQVIVKVNLPANDSLKPGMFLRANITTATITGQTVPMTALLPQANGKAIAFVVQENDTVEARTVEMGEILANERVEVLNGLQPGEQIVVKGASYLKDGDRISEVSK
jgi:multidrug efflux pump subunit AcrA (membrane-fusion protein)